LAYLARLRGDLYRCLHWIDEASKSKAKAPVNQHCLKGKILFEMGKLADSGNEFKFVIEKMVGDDSYSFIGLATIAFQQAMNSKDNKDQDQLLIRSYNKYLEILSHDQSNCFAVLGVANVLAYFNKTEDAQEIYKLLS